MQSPRLSGLLAANRCRSLLEGLIVLVCMVCRTHFYMVCRTHFYSVVPHLSIAISDRTAAIQRYTRDAKPCNSLVTERYAKGNVFEL